MAKKKAIKIEEGSKKIKKMLKIEQIRDLLRSETGVAYEVDDDHCVRCEVDRGDRIDHGGGDDGDDWMDDGQVDALEREYQEKHQSKINRTKDALAKAEIDGDVQFDYGEKGHCTIYVHINRKK